MNILCKCLGGSHMYGLNTPQSDEDIRGVYALSDFSDIAGMTCNNNFHYQDKADGKDVEYKEFRDCLKLLKNGNTQMIELLYNQNWIQISDFWCKVQNNRHNLIDPEKLYKSLLGYAAGEIKLANGERTGKLGSKRKQAIEKYGFSPKNFCNLFRLLLCGGTFFQTGIYPLNAQKYELGSSHNFLAKVKNSPESFTKEDLNRAYYILEDYMKASYESPARIIKGYQFKDSIANQLIEELYFKK